MARINDLENFLTDVASAIKEKRNIESTQEIYPEDFDTEIQAIETGMDTSDATAVASDILSGKTAYNGTGKITGTHVDLDTSDATAVAGDIMTNKTAYVDGVKITGTHVDLDTSDATATASDIAKNKTAYVDGVKIIGVAEQGGVDPSDATATEDDVLFPKTFYNASGKVTGDIHATYGKNAYIVMDSYLTNIPSGQTFGGLVLSMNVAMTYDSDNIYIYELTGKDLDLSTVVTINKVAYDLTAKDTSDVSQSIRQAAIHTDTINNKMYVYCISDVSEQKIKIASIILNADRTVNDVKYWVVASDSTTDDYIRNLL